jgi:heparin binding hemagglutinin HbhA
MALVADIRKTVTDATPVLAAVGVTDLAVEKVRDARARASAVRAELDPTDLQIKAQARVFEALEQGKDFPALALNRSLELAGRAQESYDELVTRGDKLVRRVRKQKSTKDLIAQAESTVALGKGAVTTVRKSANEIQRSAKATFTTGRHQAGAASEVIGDEAGQAKAAVKKSATRTRTAAKRTATTTKKSAVASKSAAKGAATSATKTAEATQKAATAAAEKVGD